MRHRELYFDAAAKAAKRHRNTQARQQTKRTASKQIAYRHYEHTILTGSLSNR